MPKDEEIPYIAPELRRFAVEISSLTRDPENARSHGEKSVLACARSLKRFGQQSAIIYDPKSRKIISGNGRHEAAQDVLRWKYIAAVPTNLDEQDHTAFALADNRTAEMSDWNTRFAEQAEALLEEELEELSEIELNELGLGEKDIEEIEKELKKAKKTVEAKEVAASETRFHVVITCSSKKNSIALATAIKSGNAREIAKQLQGSEVREKSD